MLFKCSLKEAYCNSHLDLIANIRTFYLLRLFSVLEIKNVVLL